MSKRENGIIDSYNRNFCRRLEDCYNKPSTAKKDSWYRIIQEMIDNNGSGLTVISYNIHQYTCAYTMVKDGVKILVYHTPNKRIEILM